MRASADVSSIVGARLACVDFGSALVLSHPRYIPPGDKNGLEEVHEGTSRDRALDTIILFTRQ